MLRKNEEGAPARGTDTAQRDARQEAAARVFGAAPSVQRRRAGKSEAARASTAAQEAQRAPMTPGETLALALELVSAGLHVLPCKDDKTPSAAEGYKSARVDADEVRKLFEGRAEGTLVGIACGASNILVLDGDKPGDAHKSLKNDGVEYLEKIRDCVKAETGKDIFEGVPVIETPSGGRHYIFQQSADCVLGNSKGDLPDGVDVRGDGGYIIAPECRTSRGDYKQVSGPDLIEALKGGALPVVPDEIRAMLRPKAKVSGASRAERLAPEFLKEALSKIPNDGEPGKGGFFEPRDRWIDMLHAIHGASGGEEWGKELWLEWSGNVSQDMAYTEERWLNMNAADVRSGAGYIRQQLERLGETDFLARLTQAQAPNVFRPANFDLSTFRLGAGETNAVADNAEDDAALDELFEFVGRMPLHPPRAIVDDLIPAEGLTFIGGQSGVAKSFVAVHLSVCLAAGLPFLGRKIPERLGVVYYAAEGHATIKPRVDAAQIGLGLAGQDLPVIVMMPPGDLKDARNRMTLRRALVRIAKKLRDEFAVRLGAVIFDTIGYSHSLRDANSYAEVSAVCHSLTSEIDKFGAATIALHHFGKDQSAGLTGTVAFRAVAESVLAVIGDRNELTGTCTNRRLVHSKSRVGEEGATWPFELKEELIGQKANGADWNVGRLDVKAEQSPYGAARSASRSEAADESERRVLRAMRSTPGTGMAPLAMAAGLSGTGALHRILARLIKDKLVTQDRKSRKYALTEEGRNAAEGLEREANDAARGVF